MPDSAEDDPPVRHNPQSQRGARGPLPLVVVAVIALVALGLSSWSLLRPAASTTPAPNATSYTDGQRAEGKTKICGAFDAVRRGVTQNTNLQAPGGPGDVVGSWAVAANARLSLYDGGQYLLARLDPATPSELADPIRAFANNLMDIGAAATAGAVNTEPAQAARLRDADAENATVTALCG